MAADEDCLILVCQDLNQIFGQSAVMARPNAITPYSELLQRFLIQILPKAFETSLSRLMSGDR